jgi:hypothetical protein
MLTVWLEYQRSTLLWKCEGLDGAALARQVLPPSSLTLLGLVRHMAIVEWWWFDHILTGSSSPEPISTTDDLALFQRQCEVSRAIASAAPSLDVTSTSTEKPTVSLRWVMIHMIEEYARHNGHADLLREQIDGVVGE